jgi:hypothetical protein
MVRTSTLKECLLALRGFSVRVESQGLESGTELVREEGFLHMPLHLLAELF